MLIPFWIVGHERIRAAVVEGAAEALSRGGQGLLPVRKVDSGMRIIGERRLQDNGHLHRVVGHIHSEEAENGDGGMP